MSEERQKHHEERDVDAWRVAGYGMGLMLFLLVAGHLAPLGLFKFLSRVSGSPSPTLEQRREIPPPPQLQSRPAEEFRRFREAEQKQLSTYGWVDRLNGVARIPIDRAMDLIAARGVPPHSDLRETPPAQGSPAAPAKKQPEKKP